MCGIVGFTAPGQDPAAAKQIVQGMADLIRHRGPDGEGCYADGTAALGHRRLSVIDLAGGGQPMLNEDGTLVVVFNGEIYNYKTLRARLQQRGHTFATDSDTEVLLHGYEEWGRDLPCRLRGMFAFAVWDRTRGTLFCARDLFGIKPLCYYKKGETLLFASEIKAFLDHPSFAKRLNTAQLPLYLSCQYSPGRDTFFAGVQKLLPGHFLEFSEGIVRTTRWVQPAFLPGDTPPAPDELEAVLRQSAEAHKIADVEVAGFLSGGVDSAYLTALARPARTYTISYAEPKYDESFPARALARNLGLRNRVRCISPGEFWDAVPAVQYHMDEPQSNLSSVPLWFLAEMARKDVTVVLSGEGADELFGGYAYYEDTVPVRKYKKMVPLPIRRALGNLALHMPYFKGHNFLVKGAEIPEKSFLGQALVWPEREVDGVLKPEYNTGDGAFELAAPIYARVKGQPELVKKQYLDMNMWLPGDILLKADKMCMAHSLELRVPFLDRKVMEFAEHIPDRYRINENGNKQVLRHAANKSLPDEWATRPKVGFPVPIVYWLREQKWYDYVKEYFTAPWASEFFNTDELMHLLDLHFAGKGDFQRKIYTPLVFLVWYKRFFIDEDQPAVQAA